MPIHCDTQIENWKNHKLRILTRNRAKYFQWVWNGLSSSQEIVAVIEIIQVEQNNFW